MQAPLAVRRSPSTRRSLLACTAEGACAEIVGACTGSSVIAAWALHLGAGPFLVGALWGLPQLAHVLQLPSAWITARLGRRRVAITAVAVARQTTLALLVAPLFAPSPGAARSIVFGVVVATAVFGVVGHNAWMAWIGDLVPAGIRGRYFGRRTAICTAIGTAASFVSGRFLDKAAAHGESGRALALLTVLGSMAALVTTLCMREQHDPPGVLHRPPRLRDLAEPLGDRAARRLLLFKVFWNASLGLTASLYALTMIQTIKIGFAGVAAYGATVALARVIANPIWGRVIDRAGARRVIALTTLGSALSSMLWLAAGPGRAWPIAIDAILSGVLQGGSALALFTMPLAVAPRASRPIYLAAFLGTAGISFGLASAAGGALASALAPSGSGAGAWPIFAAASAGRTIAALLALRLVEPPKR